MSGKRSFSVSTMPCVSSTDSVVCVTKASLRARNSGEASSARRCTSAMFSTRITAPSGSWPSVPTTSGWPAWPTRMMVWPRRWCSSASRWTLVTSGQVASMWKNLRAVASAGTALGTPWAEKMTGASVGGISSSSSTKTAPFFFRDSTTYLLCTISWRT